MHSEHTVRISTITYTATTCNSTATYELYVYLNKIDVYLNTQYNRHNIVPDNVSSVEYHHTKLFFYNCISVETLTNLNLYERTFFFNWI